MPESPSQQKAALRNAAREQLRKLTSEERESASETIRARLTASAHWQNAQAILLFASRQDEPDIWALATNALEAGKRVAFPRYVAASDTYEAAEILNPTQDVVTGKFGVLEPKPDSKVADLKRLDLVLVPGLAFDRHGYRLGRGKGFYDRLLAAVSGWTCGVAFDAQLVSTLPVEPHDVPLNCILTPTHWLEF